MMTNNFNFTFGEDYKTDFTTYVNEIIAVTRAQVQAKREAVKGYIEVQKDPTEESIVQVNRKLAGFSETLANRQLRMQIIENLTDCYVSATGERPEPKQLERLTGAILNEELTDPNPHKVSQEERPFMSTTQMSRRQHGTRGNRKSNVKGEWLSNLGGESEEDTNGNHSRVDSYLAIDGKTYRKPIRRTRGNQEAVTIENNTKSRNEERRKKYVEFTKTQPVYTWNMYE